MTSDSLTWQTVIFTIAARFPLEETRDWTHTYTQRDKLWRWTPHSTSRIRLQHDPFFSALYANSIWGFLTSCFWTDLWLYSSSASCTCWYGYRSVYDPTTNIISHDSVTNSGVSWIKLLFCQITAHSAAFRVSETPRARRRQAKQSSTDHCTLGLRIAFNTVSCIFRSPASIRRCIAFIAPEPSMAYRWPTRNTTLSQR